MLQSLSVILPIYNEEESLPHLIPQVVEVLTGTGLSFEIIAVNDGSTDGSFFLLEQQAAQDFRFKVVSFRRNFGQTAAFAAGVQHAKGEVLILMDADLQNDPKDIPKLLQKMQEGYDVVSGWRQKRQDSLVSRRLPSRLANSLISFLTGVSLHDYGCSLKAYRREVIQDLRLYGEMHRFIPAYAAIAGARIVEVPVTHHSRRYGRSKYTIARTGKVVLDLFVAKFIGSYLARPMHFFGFLGIGSIMLGGAAGIMAIVLKVVKAYSFISTPLPLATVFLVMIGIQFLLIGLIAEILARTYFESQQKRPYTIQQTLNLETT